MFTGDRQIVGKCSICGGVVSLPNSHMSVNRPIARCESCGACEDESANLPVVPMIPGSRYKENKSEPGC